MIIIVIHEKLNRQKNKHNQRQGRIHQKNRDDISVKTHKAQGSEEVGLWRILQRHKLMEGKCLKDDKDRNKKREGEKKEDRLPVDC